MAGGSPQRGADVAPETAWDVVLRATRPHFVALVLMAALANILAGLFLARQSDRTGDFHQIMAWSREWIGGGNPYAPPDSIADYPPNALVTLAPLAAMGVQKALEIWMWMNAALAVATGRMASRLARLGSWTVAFAAVVVMLPAFRTFNQFSIAAFAPALAGFLLAPRYPVAGGLAIGVSLMKPHIGGPALLWAIAARRWETVAAAFAVPCAFVATYCFRAGETPFESVRNYSHALARSQNRPAEDYVPGETNLQPLLEWTAASPLTQQLIVAAVLTGALAFICVRRREDFDLRFYAAACLMSLLSFRHLGYNLLLAIPALAFLWTRAGIAARVITAVSFAVLIASPPTLWRHVLEPRGWASPLDAAVPHAYRAVVVLLFLATISLGVPIHKRRN